MAVVVVKSAMDIWSVHKFGGTSLADADCYRRAADILRGDRRRLCVVVSGQGVLKDPDGGVLHDKVTSTLLECARLAADRRDTYETLLKGLIVRAIETTQALNCPPAEHAGIVQALYHDWSDLKAVLRSIWLSKSIKTTPLPWWSGYGEIWSARLMAAYLKQQCKRAGDNQRVVEWIDARNILVISHRQDGQIVPDIDQTKTNWKMMLSNPHTKTPDIIVITGFICSNVEGEFCTLGRDGSDHSASIMSAVLSAQELTIWTDVDGIYSADPSIVKDAVVCPYVSYQEAMELAYFGAKVLHPKTMTPLIGTNINIHIRNAFNPTHPGSIISLTNRNTSPRILGFSTIQNLTVINVEGCGMIGTSGIAYRLFGAILNCSVVVVSQAGSEHSICIALPSSEAEQAMISIQKEFRDELVSHEIETIESFGPCACLAAVGDGMHLVPGIAGSIFKALGDASINCRAISQGASERNISIMIDQKDVNDALNAVHRRFIWGDDIKQIDERDELPAMGS